MSKRGPRFTEKEMLATVKEGEKNGLNAVWAAEADSLISLTAIKITFLIFVFIS